MTDLTPREIVSELDRYIVGQRAAKRAVAIALRNRWRRQQVAAGQVAATVDLLDANHEVVAASEVETNAFGSASGEFTVPSGRLLGR